MNFLSAAFKYALLLQAGFGVVHSKVYDKDFTEKAPSGQYIVDSSYYLGRYLHTVTSNAPVTIQRYTGETLYPEGVDLLGDGDAYLVVNSDCGPSEAYNHRVTWGANGPNTLDVTINGAPSNMSFIVPSWYEAKLTWCPTNLHQSPASSSGTSSLRGSPETETSSGHSYVTSFKRFLEKSIFGTKSNNIEHLEDEEVVGVETTRACNINVEVMINGCSQGVDVYAPSIRVIDDSSGWSERPEKKNCIRYEADVTFFSKPAMTGKKSLSVGDRGGEFGCKRGQE